MIAKESFIGNDPKGKLQLLDVRINEARTCLITTHSMANTLDSHLEFTVYQKETPSMILLHAARLGQNFLYREGGQSLICSKEELKDPFARIQTSTCYSKGDMRVLITKFRESKALHETTEVSVKSTLLKSVIKSALAGEDITTSQLSGALRNYLHCVSLLRAYFIGKGVLTMKENINAQQSTREQPTREQPTREPPTPMIRKQLNGSVPPYQPTFSRISLEGTSKVKSSLSSASKHASETEKINPNVCPGLSGIKSSPGAALQGSMRDAPSKLDLHAIEAAIGAKQPLSFPMDLSDPTAQSSQLKSNIIKDAFAKLDTKNPKKDGKVPPPNTPATPSGPGSPIPSPIKSARSRASSTVFDEDDDLCGVNRIYPQPQQLPQPRKTTIDLLGSIDELLLESVDDEEDLICMSPVRSSFFISENEDLLVG